MKFAKQLVGLWLIFSLAACQMPIPAPAPPSTATITPGPSPTPTPTLTPTPLPTPVPVARIETGDRVLFYGDYDAARAQYQAAYDDSTDPSLKAAALWGLSRTNLSGRRYDAALTTLEKLTSDHPDSTYAARAYFLMGQAYSKSGKYAQAANAYNTYLAKVPGVLDSYVQELRGDSFAADQNNTDALTAYNAALAAPHLAEREVDLQIKAAQARAAIGDYAGALMIYNDFAANSPDDYVKSQMDYLAGKAHLSLEQSDEGYGLFRHAVENYPLSYYSYLALVELVDANQPIGELERGLVDYFAAQYDVALSALDRYIAATPGHDGTALYYRALTLRELNRPEEAVKAFDDFIRGYATHPKWVQAWREKAFTEWAFIGDYNAAEKTLLEFVSAVPASPESAAFLMDAARVYERDNNLEQAAQTWERIASDYPTSEQVPLALFWAGIARYRLRDYAGALTLFQRDLLLALKPEDRARAHLWIGKTHQQLGNVPAAQEAWQQGQAVDITGYYSERAKDLLIGREPFDVPSASRLDLDLTTERKEAAAWMRLTFNLPAETDFNGPGALAQDARFIRGTELWELGLYDEARLEFEDLREAVNTSPTDSFRLANHLADIGLYRSAVFAARQVLTLAGQGSDTSALMAPPYFNHIRYGLYYFDLIIPEAQAHKLEPLFVFSIVRQESLFEGFVRSTAGARGLMQIIPTTGGHIANDLNWPLNFDPEDLYRPNVSIRFGAYYLAHNRDLLGGDLYAALAAYNAGPGNAAIWKNLAGDDPDLLLEIIRFQETRDYIRFIYEIYNIYRTLYSPVQ